WMIMSDKSTSHTETLPPGAQRSRRAFLRSAATIAAVPAAASLISSCIGKDKEAAAASTATGHAGAHPAPAAPVDPRAKADAMDKMHEAGIKAFPAKTTGKGNQLLDPRIEGGVKVFELTAREIQWELSPGKFSSAMAYNNQVPGPQIRVREGDRVRVVLKNELLESTAIHF